MKIPGEVPSHLSPTLLYVPPGVEVKERYRKRGKRRKEIESGEREGKRKKLKKGEERDSKWEKRRKEIESEEREKRDRKL